MPRVVEFTPPSRSPLFSLYDNTRWSVSGVEPYSDTHWAAVDAVHGRDPDERHVGEWEDSDTIDEGQTRLVVTRRTRSGEPAEVEERRDLYLYLRRPIRTVWHAVRAGGNPPVEVEGTRWEFGNRVTLVPDEMIPNPENALLSAILMERAQANA